MDKGTEIYKSMIDELAKMSTSCADARAVKKGKVPGIDAEKMGINELLSKLDDSERDVLAEFIGEVYHAGIYDTLEQMEWLRCCKNMTITVDGEVLPLAKYEGIPNDYFGRRSGWDWSDE